MVPLSELLDYVDQLLAVGTFNDYCPNGLQVEGRQTVRRLVSGVTACQELLERAAAWQADAVLVHHGYFWKGEDPRVTGMKRRRLQTLLAAEMNLIAYHLPLDAHPELGNNAGLGKCLGLYAEGNFGRDGLGVLGRLAAPLSVTDFAAQVARALDREPLLIAGGGNPVTCVGWCTGGAEGYLEAAAQAGADLFISGEVSEPTFHVARELGIHYLAAGHHATERFGVRALGEHLAARFGIEHQFIDIPNPI